MFSVVICTYNNVGHLGPLIRGLLEELLVGEIIIIDNASTDNTKPLLDGINDKHTRGATFIKVITNSKNGGVVIPRNQGLKIAQEEFSIILDDDQITASCTFSKYVSALCDYGIVGYIPGVVTPKKGAAVVTDNKTFANHVGEGGICMKTCLWKDLNYFDEAFSPAYFEGPDLQLRALQQGNKIACVQKSGIVHLHRHTLERGDVGFNIERVGSAHFELLMGRLKKGYYGNSYNSPLTYV